MLCGTGVAAMPATVNQVMSAGPVLPRAATPVSPARPKLLDQLSEALRSRHYSRRTEQTYCHWVKRYVHFHNLRHPADMGEPEINAFLTHLAVHEKVAASTQNQALSALLSLYRHVFGREVGDLGEVIRARKPKRLPVVMTRDEVKAVLANLSGDKWLMASLMYGAGLRLMECLRLRVQDIDFSRNEILSPRRQGRQGPDHDAARIAQVPVARATQARQDSPGARPGRRLGPCAAARRAGPQISQRAEGVALAMGLCAGKPLEKPENG